MKHMLQGCPIADLIKLCQMNGINLKYLDRIAYILSLSALHLPLQLIEKSLYSEKINSVTIKSPVFIIGHYRSGTTHLHNIMSQDSDLAYLKLKDVRNPYSAILSHKLFHDEPRIIFNEAGDYPKRTPDSMIEGPEEPEEDEFALINMGVSSFYSGLFFFPHQLDHYMKYLTFTGVDQKELDEWKKQLMVLYQKISLINGGKRILNKNPHYTGMVKYLLEIFPDAKFIHIYRNPYLVYISSLRAFRLFMETYTLQDIPSSLQMEEKVFEVYTNLMQAYFSDKHLIPEKNLIEVRYEDLERNPLCELEKIYTCIESDRFPTMRVPFQKYLDTLSGYQKVKHEKPDPKFLDQIYNRLAFAIDEWNYVYDNNDI